MNVSKFFTMQERNDLIKDFLLQNANERMYMTPEEYELFHTFKPSCVVLKMTYLCSNCNNIHETEFVAVHIHDNHYMLCQQPMAYIDFEYLMLGWVIVANDDLTVDINAVNAHITKYIAPNIKGEHLRRNSSLEDFMNSDTYKDLVKELEFLDKEVNFDAKLKEMLDAEQSQDASFYNMFDDVRFHN